MAERGGFPVGAFLSAFGVAAAGAAGALQLDRLGLTLCMFKRLTGLPCATCGSTRAFTHLARLDLAGAVALNPLAALAAVVVAAWGAIDLLLLLRGRTLSIELPAGEARALGFVLLAAFVLNWAYVLAAGR